MSSWDCGPNRERRDAHDLSRNWMTQYTPERNQASMSALGAEGNNAFPGAGTTRNAPR
jgi:hypothetical protein